MLILTDGAPASLVSVKDLKQYGAEIRIWVAAAAMGKRFAEDIRNSRSAVHGIGFTGGCESGVGRRRSEGCLKGSSPRCCTVKGREAEGPG